MKWLELIFSGQVIEVLSTSNTKSEIDEKKRLYFETVAKEVGICSMEGELTFFASAEEVISTSKLFPDFPKSV